MIINLNNKEEIKNEIKEQYKNWANQYDHEKIKIFEKAGIDYDKFMKYFLDFCNLKQGIKILDIGAGTGLISIALCKKLNKKCEIIAIEPVEEMIDQALNNIAKEGFEDIITIRKGIGEKLLFEDNSFDLITCSFAIRHMEIEKALKEFERIIKPKGLIVIADICAPMKWRSGFGKFLAFFFNRKLKKKYKGELRSKVFTIEEWKELLNQLGFKINNLKEYFGKRDPNWELKRIIIAIKCL